MARPAKTKGVGDKASAPADKKKVAPKKNKLYETPEHIPEGTILTDVRKKRWLIGSSIGTGGFGEIYSACNADTANRFDYVVKCEPFENGPLFVEMNFYQRHLKEESIKEFKQQHNLKSLGLPHLLGTGSVVLNDKKHRFIVMPRYGNDLQKLIDKNGGKIPEGTVYRLAIQMLDVFECLHSVGYVHSDLKAQNILLGYGTGGNAQAFLVDFGLAAHEKVGSYKADPKKMHNGTINYTSRDAHNGITTKRTDFEILGYNLIEWLGGILPWVKDKLLQTPAKVQAAKEKFMKDLKKGLAEVFPQQIPVTLKNYMTYVAQLECADIPDYDKCRKIFADGLKLLKIPNTGDLDFQLKSVGQPTKARGKKDQKIEQVGDGGDEIDASNSDDDFAVTKKTKVATKRTLPAKVIKSPVKKSKIEPKIARKVTPIIKTPVKRQSARDRSRTAENSSSSIAETPSPRQKKIRTPLTAKTTININPAITVGRPSPTKTKAATNKVGKTTVNSHLTPPVATKRNGNKYEFNIELDVSMDADVKVNVKRKRRPESAKTPTVQSSEDASPTTRSKGRKVEEEANVRVAKVITSKRK